MRSKENISVIGIDIGGTKILAGKITAEKVAKKHKVLVPKGGSEEDVMRSICAAVDSVIDSQVSGIGIGVPSIVDVEKGIVYDVQNIPSWKEVHLKEILESKYGLPVSINNDANCFAMGELYFGKGKQYSNFVGLIVGTGMAAGLIINKQLHSGANCGAGEFGTIPYLDHCFEYYSSGQFFENVYQRKGEEVFQLANQGDLEALAMFEELGMHLGNAIQTILYAIDPAIIILGGSVSQAYQHYQKSLWKNLQSFVYSPTVKNLKIDVSTNKDIALLGAAALALDTQLHFKMNTTINSG